MNKNKESIKEEILTNEMFLDKLKSSKSSKYKYKRLALSTLRYAGGKSLAVGHIVEHLPKDVKKIVSPFFGGGSIEIALAKYLGIDVIGYDIFDILVNFWNVQINNKEKLFEGLNKIEPTKENYEKIKIELKKHWNKEIVLDSETLAIYYFFNFNLSYGPSFLGWISSVYSNRKKYDSMLNKIKNFETIGKIEVRNERFEDILESHKDDYLYLDPPYHLGDDGKMFKGIYPTRNFPVHHNGFNHELLAEILNKHEGGFILSYNDSPTIRELYKDCKIIVVDWQYTMGQGETRIGKNRKENNIGHIKKSHEVLIIKEPIKK